MSAIIITINGTTYSADENDLLVITSTGLYNSTKLSQIYTFVSTGGRFLGFNTSSGQSSPSIGYGLLDTFTALEDLVLYSVEQQPSKVFDLSTLELSAGDHVITVKSKGNGYGDSVASNEITYNPSSGGSILRIYDDTASLAESFTLLADGVEEEELPITYIITTSVTNGTYTGSTSINKGGTASVTISANSGYSLPSSITITGATGEYNSSTGVINLSAPTGNISISATCQADTPDKIILDNGGNIIMASDGYLITA